MISPLLHPILFCSFANDRDDRARNLSEQARAVRRILAAAESRGHCELVLHQNAMAGDILDVFQDAYTRIAIFHFDGHADGYRLLLETAADRCHPKERRATPPLALNRDCWWRLPPRPCRHPDRSVRGAMCSRPVICHTSRSTVKFALIRPAPRVSNQSTNHLIPKYCPHSPRGTRAFAC